MISRTDWRIHGDLLQWLVEEYPNLLPEQFEAAYRLFVAADLAGQDDAVILVLLRGCEETARQAARSPKPARLLEEGATP